MQLPAPFLTERPLPAVVVPGFIFRRSEERPADHLQPSSKRRCVSTNNRARNLNFVQTKAATLTERPTSSSASHSTQPDRPDENFDWHAHWYAVGYEGDFSSKAPNSFTLLGEQLCIWKDGMRQWQAFLDCCPHRLVPLSEGRITASGQLQCAYHGWNFNSTGKCTAIPQGGNMNNSRTCAKVYQCATAQGLLWVKPKPAASGAASQDVSDIPTLPEIDAGWIDSSTFRDLPYDYATLLENLVDTGHVPFTHHASVSLRSSADELKLDVTKRGPWGFAGRNERGPRKGQLGAQDTEFRAPCLMRSTIDAQATKGFSNITCVYAIPTVPGRCRAIVRNVFLFKSPVPRFVFRVLPKVFTHLGNNNVLEDDVIFLHKQEQLAVERGLGTKPAAQVYHMPGQSDNFVTAFRTWLQKYAGGGPWGPMDASWLQAAGPRLSKRDLLERYDSHTAHCQICQTALQRVRLAQQVLRHTTTALFVVAASLAAVALATSHSGPGVGFSDAESTVGEVVMGMGAKKMIIGSLMILGSNIVKFIFALLPSATPSIRMATALGVALVAGAVGLVQQRLAKLEGSFYQGSWPPPRNTQKTNDEALA